MPLTDKSVVGYLPSPAPGLPITTAIQPPAIHPRAKRSNTEIPSFLPLSRSPPIPSQPPPPPPHSLTQLAPVCQWGRSVRRRPVAVTESHAALCKSSYYLSSTCHPAPNPTCHSARPLYSTRWKNTKHASGKSRHKICPNPTLSNVALAQRPPMYFQIKFCRILWFSLNRAYITLQMY